MKLTVLPETIRYPLAEYADDDGGHPYADADPPLVAVYRPLSVEALAAWGDAWRLDELPRQAIVALVRQQLVTIEGLVMEDGGTEMPYEHGNPRHFASLPFAIVHAIYRQLDRRASLSPEQKKSSGSPSGSAGTTSSAHSPAASAPSPSATATDAVSPATNGSPLTP